MIRLDKLNDHRTSAFRPELPAMTASDTTSRDKSTLPRAAAGFENVLEGLLILQITLIQGSPGVSHESRCDQNSPHGGGNLPSRGTWHTLSAGHRSWLLPPRRILCCFSLRRPGSLWAASPIVDEKLRSPGSACGRQICGSGLQPRWVSSSRLQAAPTVTKLSTLNG